MATNSLIGSYNGYAKSTDGQRSLSDELLAGYNKAQSGTTDAPEFSMKGGYEAKADDLGVVKAADFKSFGMGDALLGGLAGMASNSKGGEDFTKLFNQFNTFQKQPTIQNTYDFGGNAETAGRIQMQQFLTQQMRQLQPYMKYPSFGGR